MKSFVFKNGNPVPALGLGTWKLSGDQALESTLKSLEVGYRHIDTADRYGNHREVGKAIKKSGINRDKIFITSKVWYSDLSASDLKSSVSRFLEELQVDYIDLLLIHWPNRTIPLGESLKTMDQLREDKIIKNLGVSNFTINHLKDCLESGVEVVNNQVEIHATFGQFELQKFAKQNGILLTAYSPLGRGADLEIPQLVEIARKYEKTVPQVIINWLISRGIITIPKATSFQHIKQNFEVFDFELSGEDIKKINNLDKGERLTDNRWSEFDY